MIKMKNLLIMQNLNLNIYMFYLGLGRSDNNR